MRDYRYLEEISLDEVAKNTQIEINCLKYILNKDYEKLQKFNLKGFSKILAREYDIDLSSFIEEYELYLVENDLKVDYNIKLSPKMESYSTKASKIWLWLIIIAALLALASYFNFFSFLYDLKGEFSSEQIESKNVIKAKENIKKLEKNQITQLVPSKELLQDFDLNASKQAFEEANDINTTKDIKALEENEEVQQDINSSINTKSLDKPFVTFIVKDKFWIGTVRLDNFTKQSYIVDKDFKLSLENDLLITTGHADFSTDFDGVITEYKGGSTKYLLYENKVLKRIKRSEFITRNRGNTW